MWIQMTRLTNPWTGTLMGLNSRGRLELPTPGKTPLALADGSVEDAKDDASVIMSKLLDKKKKKHKDVEDLEDESDDDEIDEETPKKKRKKTKPIAGAKATPKKVAMPKKAATKKKKADVVPPEDV